MDFVDLHWVLYNCTDSKEEMSGGNSATSTLKSCLVPLFWCSHEQGLCSESFIINLFELKGN